MAIDRVTMARLDFFAAEATEFTKDDADDMAVCMILFRMDGIPPTINMYSMVFS
jgi:hypothetical protein